MADRKVLEALLRDNLGTVDRIVASLCRRNGLSGDDADDFASWTRMRLVENDYAILGKFRGESSLATYLTVVISMLFREYRVREWGRWRPSAAAKRLGAVAIRLETLVYRDGHTLAQAAQVLRSKEGVTLSDRELAAMLAQFPPRRPPGPPELGTDALAAAPAAARADDLVAGDEADRQRRRTEDALLRSLESLPSEDRMIVRMRFWEDMSVADIGRGLNLPQKPLYRRLERAFSRLREHLEAAGVSREQVRGLLHERSEEAEWR
ncbi:MAG TPA: sigma-70 family RNA polymerase sigma factor [Longimicrobium sp.]|nr:sigma-70 family RNA polymerase sigma factor [Longimicrobium sp.]